MLFLLSGCWSPTPIPTPEPTDVPSQDTAPPTPTGAPEPPTYTLSTVLEADNCPYHFDAECYIHAGPQLLDGTTLAVGQSRRPPGAEFEPLTPATQVFSASGEDETYDCAMVAEINGTRYCAYGETEPFEVGPADDPTTRWPLGASRFFFACDPDGDGTQALCTGEGADEPPFDGVLDVQWSEPLPDARVALDRPGFAPLLFERSGSIDFVGDPALRAAMPEASSRILHLSSIEGRVVVVAPRTDWVSLVEVVPPYTRQDLQVPTPNDYNVVGRFLPGQDPVLVVFGGSEPGWVLSLTGDVLGTVEPDRRLSSWYAALVMDPEGDGVDEMLVTDVDDFFLLRLTER